MTKPTISDRDSRGSGAKHPPIVSIEDVIVFKLARLVGLNERTGQRWTQKLFDLSINEWRLLALTQAHGPAHPGDLADLMLMDKSQLSRLIKALGAKGLIKNKLDPKDARAVVLSLTARGRTLYDDVIKEVIRRNERVLAPLSTAEVQVFDEMLGRLIDHNLTLWERLER